jgi:hypothetical protein
MVYDDFTLEIAESSLGVMVRPGDLFPGMSPAIVPDWY